MEMSLNRIAEDQWWKQSASKKEDGSVEKDQQDATLPQQDRVPGRFLDAQLPGS